MKKSLKILEETISDLENEIKTNPHPFLISTLERLKLYRDYEIDRVLDKISAMPPESIDEIGGFRGFGIP